MHDTLYHVLVGALDLVLWGGKLEGEENLPREGPAVFIANHLDATGPIACCCSLPMRVFPWSVGDMMDPELASDYLDKDFCEKTLRLKPPLSVLISHLLSKITVPMFHSLGCIPVYKGDYKRMQETLNMSMNLLRQGKFLLIFPEDPILEADEITGMKPFQHTFARLGEMYHAESRKRLAFIPLAIHPRNIIQVGEPVYYNPVIKMGMERQRIKDLLETEVHRLYIKMGNYQAESGALTLERK
jgi:1-acyl-sn-glycerol-3-phosphate acyltransferase